MVNKITSPITSIELINKTNEIIDNLGSGAITIDDALSTTSENPVQNKVITNALDNKVNTSDFIAYTATEVETLWGSIA